MYRSQRVHALAATAVAALGLSACVANAPAGSSTQALTVDISDEACVVSANTSPSGVTTFMLTNNGTVRNEFEILADDKLRIVGERENVGPGTTVEYTIALQPGTYYTACKTNMVGALVGVAEFTVTDSGQSIEVSADDQELIDSAVTNYTAYVRDQAGQLLEGTEKFVELYLSGDTEAAKAAYAPTRMHYERIEPTAEAFGDIDPALDLREVDFQAGDSGVDEWIGWHVIEKDLWRPEGYAGLSDADKERMAKQLLADTQRLYDLVYSEDFSINIDEISNGAITLLEEVATTKITGEEEAFSHTDLWDFVANVEGAKVAFGNVQALAQKKDPELTASIEQALTDLQTALDAYKDGDGYVYYDTVDEAGRKALSDKVNALRLPLAQLTAVILK
ncbi:iron uptake system protein EfeO [Schaalia suimastitidis]|uniref:iron uptake system protein EfeO n=1 Tax=Schaalia suimastitidis TaxID=121163 RepID=UPI00040E5ECB|nr:iron uptake system protein EfeO [Schaalia suimastitidis]